MNTLKAEIIFNEYSHRNLGHISPSKDYCLPAMLEFAEFNAIEFVNKIHGSGFKPAFEHTNGDNYWTKDKVEFKTTTQLYEIFKQQPNEPKPAQ